MLTRLGGGGAAFQRPLGLGEAQTQPGWTDGWRRPWRTLCFLTKLSFPVERRPLRPGGLGVQCRGRRGGRRFPRDGPGPGAPTHPGCAGGEGRVVGPAGGAAEGGRGPVRPLRRAELSSSARCVSTGPGAQTPLHSCGTPPGTRGATSASPASSCPRLWGVSHGFCW